MPSAAVTTPDQRRNVSVRDCSKAYPKAITFPSRGQDNCHFYKTILLLLQGILLLLHLQQGPQLTTQIVYN
jgi:hypothetical protein